MIESGIDKVFCSAKQSEKPLLHVHSVLAETIWGSNFVVLPLTGNFLVLEKKRQIKTKRKKKKSQREKSVDKHESVLNV